MEGNKRYGLIFYQVKAIHFGGSYTLSIDICMFFNRVILVLNQAGT